MSEEEDQNFRPDKRVVQMLAQIKDHYRNPIIAAENSVSIDEALSLFGMASAVITLMAAQLRQHEHPAEEKAGQTAAAHDAPVSRRPAGRGRRRPLRLSREPGELEFGTCYGATYS